MLMLLITMRQEPVLSLSRLLEQGEQKDDVLVVVALGVVDALGAASSG